MKNYLNVGKFPASGKDANAARRSGNASALAVAFLIMIGGIWTSFI